MSSKSVGILLFLAGFIILMGIITGEVFYPLGYHTSVNEISDLGATRPPNSVIYQPSAMIFNATMLISGFLILAAGIFLQKYHQNWLFSVVFALFGLGILGVGIFPGNVAPYHGLFALLTFVMGSLSCIFSRLILKGPFSVVGIPIGVFSLVFLFGANLFIPILGSGGTERWVAYPIVIWLIGFGGYWLGNAEENYPLLQAKIE